MNKKQKMYEQITKHGNDLIEVFNLPKNTDPVKLCKKLFSLENKLNRIMLNLCNTNNIDGIAPGYDNTGKWVQIETSEEEQEKLFDSYKVKLEKIIGNQPFVFFNHDPRGYTLKIKDSYIRNNNVQIYKDWGGYGIIAPNFNN